MFRLIHSDLGFTKCMEQVKYCTFLQSFSCVCVFVDHLPMLKQILVKCFGFIKFVFELLQILDAGFKSSKKFSKKLLHFWDLLERMDEQFSSEDLSTSAMSASNAYHRAGDYNSTYYCQEHELSCRDLFQKAVSKINENSSIGKDEKV